MLRILMLEASPLDSELVLASLASGGLEPMPVRVDTRADFIAALNDCRYDLILADASVPSCDGIAALELARERCPDVPFILVSGELGEERAIETLKSGATDYVLKHRLERLVPSVQRALREAEQRRERRRAEQALRESEERFRLLVEGVKDYALFLLDPSGCVVSWNPAAERIKGYQAHEIIGRHFSCFYTHEDIVAGRPAFDLSIAEAQGRFEGEGWRVRKDQSRFWAEQVITALRNDDGTLTGFSKITRDITERRRGAEERARLLEREQAARREAEAANRFKDEFLATVSHELRTPLTAILGWVRLLQAGKLDPATMVHAFEIIERNARAQAQIVSDLLDVSHIITGKLRLNIQRIELAPVIEAALEAVRPAAEAKDIRLETRLAPSIGQIRADAERLQQVIWNLLANAVKFTPRGGRVTVQLVRLDSSAALSVTDTGEGLDPEFLPYVFDRFRQADTTSARAHGGLGLGLAIVRHLVEQHGGNARADSPGPGQGATFTVVLPLATAELESDGAVRSPADALLSSGDRIEA